ncbi:hypothetical protein ASAC_1117 [Acidilobus saccharovorans 345-15]|uniref:Uncharacterized protein n=1 Tax=Acidilobus saccharovorans (strain DSM 16705 / JCM 18335 / VKM B-2471 / 345-15) TaxID=666510 RepID=D9Q2I4_ACIS3|nr:hypothetical protein [Acidilobus saccharovorans]ADL19522.1 hypothetical protein ASAC_1117 [Acidilobus saccharovorans 345-15]
MEGGRESGSKDTAGPLHDASTPQQEYTQMVNGDSNLKFLLFKVLSALKHFYSFKELESRLGVSAQILWRYVSLRSVPERVTAEKLLQKIEREGLIDEAIKKSLQDSDEPWQILSNPGIMTLAELKAMELFKGEKVSAIVTGKDGYSTAFGAMLSDAFHCRLCAPSSTPYSRHIIVKNYKVAQDYYDSLIFPKECVPRKGRVVIVLVDGNKLFQLSSLIDVVRVRQASLAGVVVVMGSENKLKEFLKNKLGIEVKVVSLMDFCDRNPQECRKVSPSETVTEF